MLKIYHTPPSRSVRVVWLAEEMGIPYESIAVSFNAERPPGFLAASPLNQLPAIEDDGVPMAESIAIMQYLLGKHGPTPLAVTAQEKDFAPYLQFLEFGEAGLCSIVNALVATRFMAPDDAKQNWTVDYINEAVRKRLDVVEARLEGRDYLAANRFTAADISVGWAVGMAKYFGIIEQPTPRLAAYHERVTARPAYKKAAGA